MYVLCEFALSESLYCLVFSIDNLEIRLPKAHLMNNKINNT